jgi:hypothetical protein
VQKLTFFQGVSLTHRICQHRENSFRKLQYKISISTFTPFRSYRFDQVRQSIIELFYSLLSINSILHQSGGSGLHGILLSWPTCFNNLKIFYYLKKFAFLTVVTSFFLHQVYLLISAFFLKHVIRCSIYY